MNWTDTGYRFPRIDKEADSYFEDAETALIYRYGFENVAELKQLLGEHLGGSADQRELLKIARETFRSKPREDQPIGLAGDDRIVVDFIYQM